MLDVESTQVLYEYDSEGNLVVVGSHKDPDVDSLAITATFICGVIFFIGVFIGFVLGYGMLS